MGNQASLPEKAYSAVQKNDVVAFTALMNDLERHRPGDAAARARVLEHRDKHGRTLLLVAAAKNHFQIMQQLIRLGANVHYISPSREAPGGALHEAAARRHEAAVDLLLAAGANPWAANASGRTALEEAVLAGHTGVVRAMEKHADYCGRVGVKSRTMGGMSSKYKERWAVIMPYFPYGNKEPYPPSPASSAGGAASGPTGGSAISSVTGASVSGGGGMQRSGSGALRVRRCLWLYKDRTAISPRCRLWVDGCSVVTHGPGGTEATLRLHTSHAEPVGNVATKFDRGYCIFLRPADLTASSTAEYHRFIRALGGAPPAPPPGAPGHPVDPRNTPAAAPAPPLPPPPPPGSAPTTPPPHFYPTLPTTVAFGPGGATLGPAQSYPSPYSQPPPGAPPHLPATYSYTPTTPPNTQSPSTAAAASPGSLCPMASPLTHYQQQRVSAGTPGSGGTTSNNAGGSGQQQHSWLQPALQRQQGAPQRPPAGGAPGAQQQGGATCGGGPGQGPARGDVIIEGMYALPGETDEDFAARLASAISAATGHSQDHLLPIGASAASATPHGGRPPLGPTSANAQQQQQQQRHTAPSAPPGTAPAAHQPQHSDPGGAAAGGILPPSLDSLISGQPPSTVQQHPAPAHGRTDQLTDQLDSDAVYAFVATDAAARARLQGQGQQAAPGAGVGPGHGRSHSHVPSGSTGVIAVDDGDAAPSAPLAPPTLLPAVQPPAAPRPSPAASSSAPLLNVGPAAQHSATADPHASAGRAHAPEPDPEADMCIICLSEPREVGFLHGDSVHRCVCRGCSAHVAVGAPCPLCRRPVERVLGVY